MNHISNNIVKIISFSKIPDLFNPIAGTTYNTMSGSGFIINNNGYIITCYSLIKYSKNIVVIFSNNINTFNAVIVSICPEKNIVLLKINYSNNYPILLLGDSDESNIGDIISINFFNNNIEVVNSKIIYCSRFFYTDTPFYDMLCGAPVFNSNNRVIGIVTKKTFGYAKFLPIIELVSILTELFNDKIVFEPNIFVDFVHKPNQPGCIINKINDISPFKNIHIESGDILLEINNHPITDKGYCVFPDNKNIHIRHYLKRLNSNDNIKIKYLSKSNNKYKSAKIKLSNNSILKINYLPFSLYNLNYEIFGGIVFMELKMDHIYHDHIGKKIIKNFNYSSITESKVFISHIFDGFFINKIKLEIGDIIHHINGLKINYIDDFRKSINGCILINGNLCININIFKKGEFVLKLNDLLFNDKKLSKIYNYNISNLY